MPFIQRRLKVDATLWRCIDVEATLYKRHVPTGMAVSAKPTVLFIIQSFTDKKRPWLDQEF